MRGFHKAVPKHLLEDFDGCLEPGEMCLVLGRPGSGYVLSSDPPSKSMLAAE